MVGFSRSDAFHHLLKRFAILVVVVLALVLGAHWLEELFQWETSLDQWERERLEE